MKIIEGEGNGADLIIISPGTGWTANQYIKYPQLYADFYSSVKEIRGVSLFVEPAKEYQHVQEWLAEFAGTEIYLILQNVPGKVENCTFNFHGIFFREGDTDAGGEIIGCKFNKERHFYTDNYVYISVPAQSMDIPSYKYWFINSSFSAGSKFHVIMADKLKYEYDEEGNPIYYKTPYYTYIDPITEKVYHVEDKSEIPDGAEWGGPYEIPQQKFTYEEYSDYLTAILFEKCTLGNSAFTYRSSDFSANGINSKPFPTDVDLRFVIDGKSYRRNF